MSRPLVKMASKNQRLEKSSFPLSFDFVFVFVLVAAGLLILGTCSGLVVRMSTFCRSHRKGGSLSWCLTTE